MESGVTLLVMLALVFLMIATCTYDNAGEPNRCPSNRQQMCPEGTSGHPVWDHAAIGRDK
jgi:hypothetical protein